MKKFLSLLLAVVMVLSMVPAVFAAEEVSFTDVEAGKYYEIPVMWAVNAGVTKGTGDGTTFSPSNDCTRKQVVTFLWRAAGSPEPTTKENPFPDVTKGDQFEKAILWAAESNITKGYKDGTFKPEDTCTRKQVVTFLHRYNGTPAHNVAENPFPDVTKGDQFENAILWAYENGITQGNKAGNFQPEKTCTRGDIVTFLFRSIVNAPIQISSAAALSTITVYPANSATYLVNGRLSGQYITIEAVEGVEVTVNGVAVEAVNGAFTAELTGAPTTAVVVKNNTKEIVELDASIAAAGSTETSAIVINSAGELTGIDVAADASAYYLINGRISGQYITIQAAEGVSVTVNGKEIKAVNGQFVALLDGAPTTPVVVTNANDKAVSLVASIDYAEGTEGNPIEINATGDFTVAVDAEGETVYAVNSQLNGQALIIEAADNVTVTANGNEVGAVDGVYTIILDGTPVNQIVVSNAAKKAVELDATIVLKGSETYPIEITASGDFGINVAAKGETYYAISSMLSGQVLTVAGVEEGVTVTVNGEAVEADENGVCAVVLEGAPVNKLVVANANDKAVELTANINFAAGSLNNPIEITESGDFGIDVAAKGETYYSVSSMLNGQILTVVGNENTTVTVNGEAVEADENGIFAVELKGVPANRVVIGNTADTAAELTGTIKAAAGTQNNPIEITEAGDFGIDVAAKGETYYAISSQLNGQILTVVGNENITVTVNGTAVEAKDGIFTAELTGVPANRVVIANAAETEAELTGTIKAAAGTQNNPIEITEAGDFGIDVAAKGETYYAIASTLNGQVLTVIGNENITVTVNGTPVEADYNYISTAELTGAPMNMVVVANAAETAVELSGNVNWAKGSEQNPIVIDDPANLWSVEAAAGKTYYVIPSMLNGNWLNLQAMDGVTYQVNGTELTGANFGWYSAELNAVPANRMVITNATEETVWAEASLGAKKGSSSDNAYSYYNTGIPAAMTLAAGETIYASPNAGAMIATVANAEGLSIDVNGTVYEAVDGVIEFVVPDRASFYDPPTVLAITSTTGGSYTMSFRYPLGNAANPEIVTDLSDLSIVLNEGDTGYYMNWTATETGVLKVTVSNVEVPEGATYDVYVNNLTTYTYMNYSYDAVDGVISVPVNAGDLIEINASSSVQVSMWEFSYPGGTFTMSGYVEKPVAYKLGLLQGNENKYYYFTGAMSTYYGATDSTWANGVDMYLEEVEGGYNLTFTNADGKQYVNIVASGTHINFTYGAEASSVFTMDTENNALCTVVGEETVYMGTYGTYKTMGTLKASKLKDTDYIARLYETEPEAPEVPEPEVEIPTADTELTIAKAIELGTALGGSYTEGKYYVTGEITEVYNTTYGNMYIKDAEGNELCIYGTYSADGSTRYDAMEVKPVAGDTVTVYGIIGSFNGTPQMKSGWITQHTAATPEETEPEETEPEETEPETDGETYQKITSADELTTGTYVLVASNGAAPTTIDTTTSNPWVLVATPTVDGDVVTNAQGATWTVTVDGTSAVLTDANGVAIAPKGGNSNGIKSGNYSWSWSFANGTFVFAGTGSDTVKLACNLDATNGLNRFRGYKNTTISGNPDNYLCNFTLYKLVEG